jgi:hypothetical protein
MEGEAYILMIYSVKQLPEELLANADAVLDYLEKEVFLKMKPYLVHFKNFN